MKESVVGLERERWLAFVFVTEDIKLQGAEHVTPFRLGLLISVTPIISLSQFPKILLG